MCQAKLKSTLRYTGILKCLAPWLRVEALLMSAKACEGG